MMYTTCWRNVNRQSTQSKTEGQCMLGAKECEVPSPRKQFTNGTDLSDGRYLHGVIGAGYRIGFIPLAVEADGVGQCVWRFLPVCSNISRRRIGEYLISIRATATLIVYFDVNHHECASNHWCLLHNICTQYCDEVLALGLCAYGFSCA